MPPTLRYLVQGSVLGVATILAACSDDPPTNKPANAADGGSLGAPDGGASDKDAGGSKGDPTAGKSGAAAGGGAGRPGTAGSAGARTAGTGGDTAPADAGPPDAGKPGPSPWDGLPARSVTASAPPTSSANVPEQTPAFTGQTRAPAPTSLSSVRVQTVAEGLAKPWGVEALRDGRFVITEKAGTLRVINTDGELLDPIAGVPSVDSSGQGGLLDVAIDEATTPMTLCITYSRPRDGGASTAASCATASGDNNLTITPLQMVFQQEPVWNSPAHYGSRFVFAPNNLVYITTGERSGPESRLQAQDKSKTLGKVIRLHRDGSSPSDNPFAADGAPASQVWSYGHRNPQSAALDLQGRLWTVEHGPQGGDELNLPLSGRNYGWPVITYGEDYSGEPIGDGITQMEGMEQPVYYWDPVIAPSGMLIYSGNLFSDWRGDIFIGGLVAQALVHLVLEDDRVVSEERIGLGARVRDVTQGPDGAIYVVTDESNAKLLRLTPS